MSATAPFYLPHESFFEATRPLIRDLNDRDASVPVGFLNDLNGALSKPEILKVYSVWTKRIIDADRCSVALSDGTGGIVITALNGQQGLPQGTRHDVATTFLGETFLRNEPVFTPDITLLYAPDTNVVRSMGYTAAILMPISTKDQCFGIFSASFRRHVTDVRSMLSLLQAMANCLAVQLLIVEQMTRLEQMAQTDALTGAANRHFLYEQLKMVWAEWKIDRTPFSYLTLDIDYFKSINDRHGHDIGDKVLCSLVKRLQGHIRPHDIFVRLGGEEFGLLMRETSIDAASRMSRRLRDVLADQPFMINGIRLPVTASFGVTQALTVDRSFEDIMKRADRALYDAKGNGRDCVVQAPAAALALMEG